MKLPINDLIEKVADNMTNAADMDSLISYFREGQIAFLEDMTDVELKEYASEVLGYNVDDEL